MLMMAKNVPILMESITYAGNCAQCSVVVGTGRKQKPLLQPIS